MKALSRVVIKADYVDTLLVIKFAYGGTHIQ
jgi:hypothetical protein